MRVEMIGHPGVGKSTTAKELAARLNVGVHSWGGGGNKSALTLWLERLVALVKRPRLLAVAIRCLVTERQNALLKYVVGIARRDRSVSLVSGEVLIDEGPITTSCIAVSRLDTDHPELWARRIARSLHRPDVVVLLTCDPATALHRVRNRDVRHRVAALSVSEMSRLVERYGAAADEMVVGVPLVRVDTSNLTAAQTADVVEGYLRLLLASAGEARLGCH